MRIILEILKVKKLFEPKDKKTRPLKDLVKESIFNLIRHSNKFNVKIKKFKYFRFIFWFWFIWFRMFIKRCKKSYFC